MRVGVFGGSFDPPHKGHLEVAKAAQLQANLDKVIFVPAKQNPLKPNRPFTKDRIEMLQSLIKGIKGFEIDLIEMERASPSFTIDTLRHLKSPDIELYLIIGADAASRFKEWKDHLGVISTVKNILVYPRDEVKFEKFDKMILLKGDKIPISSTMLRSES